MPQTCDIASVYLTVLEIKIFDLALLNRLAPSQRNTVFPGNIVTFEIVVVNQGNLDAYDIEVVNYLPDGMSFDPTENIVANSSGSRNSNTWSLENGIPTYAIDNLSILDSIIVPINLSVDND